jgi:hypothetical protein
MQLLAIVSYCGLAASMASLAGSNVGDGQRRIVVVFEVGIQNI